MSVEEQFWGASQRRLPLSRSPLVNLQGFSKELENLLKTEQDHEALNRYDQKTGRYPNKWADLGPRYNQ